jgi:hypothetical protein
MKLSNEAFETANYCAKVKKGTFAVAVSVHYDSRISRVVIALKDGNRAGFLCA